MDDLYLTIDQERVHDEMMASWRHQIDNDGAMRKHRDDHQFQQFRAVYGLGFVVAGLLVEQNGVINQLTRRLKDAEREISKLRGRA